MKLSAENDPNLNRNLRPRNPEVAKMVRKLAALGLTLKEIAINVSIHPNVLAKLYREEIIDGVSSANRKVASVVYKLATKEKNLDACKYWLSRRGGVMWRDKSDTNEIIQDEEQHRQAIDAPLRESREEWLARRKEQEKKIDLIVEKESA